MTARKKKKLKINGRAVGLAAAAVAAGLLLTLLAHLLFGLSERSFTPEQTSEPDLFYPLEYQEELLSASEEFSVDPCLLAALVYCESSFQADAVSPVGAVGLMQIMPETGEWLSGKIELDTPYTEESLLDPKTNLRLGCWYLSYLYARYDGQWQEALTAYIAGQGQVDQWLTDPELSRDGKKLDVIPGRDVKEYAAKVMKTHEEYKADYPDVFVCTLAPDDDGLLE